MTRNLSFSAIAFAAIACVASAAETPYEITLKNGARLNGPVLKQDDQRLFFDLGFDALTIPRDSVLELTTPTLAPGKAAAPGAAAGQKNTDQAASASGPTPYQNGASRSYASYDEMIEAGKRGVVIVSNPGGFGSGFLIDRRGHVVTNHHVVRNQRYHAVTFILRGEDGVPRPRKMENVELVAFSRLMDIALVKIPEDELASLDFEPLALGRYDSLRVGERVHAIGNPGLGRQILDHTVTDGIISSTNRNISDLLYLQTTAPVNPGNSGGPLLNATGEVIGLVTLKAFWQENIAFALPVNYIRLFLENEKSYALDKNNPNYSYRYLPPDWETAEDTQSEKGSNP